MALEVDPLDKNPAPVRVNYFAGQILTTDDLGTEQTYHRGRLAMALRHLAGFGTVAGLRVTATPEGEVRVAPGLAIDALGRLIELRQPSCLDLTQWLAGQDASLLDEARCDDPPVILADLLLRAEDAPAALTAGPDDVTPSRIEERACLVLTPVSGPALARAAPRPGAPDADTLEVVLSAWEAEEKNFPDASLGDGLLLARITIPTDPGLPILADNSVRPFILLAGRWSASP